MFSHHEIWSLEKKSPLENYCRSEMFNHQSYLRNHREPPVNRHINEKYLFNTRDIVKPLAHFWENTSVSHHDVNFNFILYYILSKRRCADHTFFTLTRSCKRANNKLLGSCDCKKVTYKMYVCGTEKKGVQMWKKLNLRYQGLFNGRQLWSQFDWFIHLQFYLWYFMN